MNNVNNAVTQALIEEIGCKEVKNLTGTPHGILNQCYTYGTDKGKFFVKVNERHALAMYEAEAKGLRSIKDTATLRVPIPYYYGEGGGHSFLILEYLELTHHTASSQSQLGAQLAQMHLAKGTKKFGYEWTILLERPHRRIPGQRIGSTFLSISASSFSCYSRKSATEIAKFAKRESGF
ncbi:MAG: hypothetical protein K940chlam7_00490 [Chlamydiae bacterium]|nr:hypothetical protein [Chlamydiota bacterium]